MYIVWYFCFRKEQIRICICMHLDGRIYKKQNHFLMEAEVDEGKGGNETSQFTTV